MAISLKDPLIHFSALGAALFALFLLTNERAPDDDTIVISQAQQAQLIAAFGRVWRWYFKPFREENPEQPADLPPPLPK